MLPEVFGVKTSFEGGRAGAASQVSNMSSNTVHRESFPQISKEHKLTLLGAFWLEKAFYESISNNNHTPPSPRLVFFFYLRKLNKKRHKSRATQQVTRIFFSSKNFVDETPEPWVLFFSGRGWGFGGCEFFPPDCSPERD